MKPSRFILLSLLGVATMCCVNAQTSVRHPTPSGGDAGVSQDATAPTDAGRPTQDSPPSPQPPAQDSGTQADPTPPTAPTTANVAVPVQGPWGPRWSFVPAVDWMVPLGASSHIWRLRVGFGAEPLSSFGIVVGSVYEQRISSRGLPNVDYAGGEVRLGWHFNTEPQATVRPSFIAHGSVVANVNGNQVTNAPSALVQWGLGLEMRIAPTSRYIDFRPAVTIERITDVDGREPGAWYGSFGLGIAIGRGAIPSETRRGEPDAAAGLQRHVQADLMRDVPRNVLRGARACRVDIPNAFARLSPGPLSATECTEQEVDGITAAIRPGHCAAWIAQATRGSGGVQDINLRILGTGGEILAEDSATDDWPTVFVCNPTSHELRIDLQGNARDAAGEDTVAAAIARFEFQLPSLPSPTACGDGHEIDDSTCHYRMNPGDAIIAYAPPGGRVCVRAPAYAGAEITVARVNARDTSLDTRAATSLAGDDYRGECVTLDPSGDGYRVRVHVPDGGALTAPVIVWHQHDESVVLNDSLDAQMLAARLQLDTYQAFRLRRDVAIPVAVDAPSRFTTIVVTGRVLGRDRRVPVALTLTRDAHSFDAVWSAARETTTRLAVLDANPSLQLALQSDEATARVAVRTQIRRPRWQLAEEAREWPVDQSANLSACAQTSPAPPPYSCTQVANSRLTRPAGTLVCFATGDGHGVARTTRAGADPTPTVAFDLAGAGTVADCFTTTTSTDFSFASLTLLYFPRPAAASDRH